MLLLNCLPLHPRLLRVPLALLRPSDSVLLLRSSAGLRLLRFDPDLGVMSTLGHEACP